MGCSVPAAPRSGRLPASWCTAVVPAVLTPAGLSVLPRDPWFVQVPTCLILSPALGLPILLSRWRSLAPLGGPDCMSQLGAPGSWCSWKATGFSPSELADFLSSCLCPHGLWPVACLPEATHLEDHGNKLHKILHVALCLNFCRISVLSKYIHFNTVNIIGKFDLFL